MLTFPASYNPIPAGAWNTVKRAASKALAALNQRVVLATAAAFVVLVLYYLQCARSQPTVRPLQPQPQLPLQRAYEIGTANSTALDILNAIINRIKKNVQKPTKPSYEQDIETSRQVLESAARDYGLLSDVTLRAVLEALMHLTLCDFLDKQTDITFETCKRITSFCMNDASLDTLLDRNLILRLRQGGITADDALVAIEQYCTERFTL